MRAALSPTILYPPSYSHLRTPTASITTVRPSRRCSHPMALKALDHERASREHHYQKNATNYRDKFYKRYQNKFCKDGHYLEKDWGFFFAQDHLSPNGKVVLESNVNFREDRVNAFVSDVTHEDLCDNVHPFSVDVVTLVFMLSAVSASKMPLILQNIRGVIKPNGYVLLRDYAVGDFAQALDTCGIQKLLID